MKIVICGSMSASKQMVEIQKFLKEKGHEVMIPRRAELYAEGKLQEESGCESTKNKIEYDLIREYYLAIESADTVLLANFDKGGVSNYIGGNSFLEAGFAHVLNKKLYFLNEVPEMIYSDELRALQPIILNGDLSKLIKL
jgi:hypothetical protein